LLSARAERSSGGGGDLKKMAELRRRLGSPVKVAVESTTEILRLRSHSPDHLSSRELRLGLATPHDGGDGRCRRGEVSLRLR